MASDAIPVATALITTERVHEPRHRLAVGRVELDFLAIECIAKVGLDQEPLARFDVHRVVVELEPVDVARLTGPRERTARKAQQGLGVRSGVGEERNADPSRHLRGSPSMVR